MKRILMCGTVLSTSICLSPADMGGHTSTSYDDGKKVNGSRMVGADRGQMERQGDDNHLTKPGGVGGMQMGDVQHQRKQVDDPTLAAQQQAQAGDQLGLGAGADLHDGEQQFA